ncbi:MAG TPA: Asp-tRNA(Asn)/Glu-tRNA(Gln) amidotransferase subunit GatC, partial [Deltaproteobacteria bacterium]|nr:Asp-tRNA(Asn)/Glu-tRNA(Gln) amidotransferase subunit GatC [Deltaproteobacteria bacterium]
MVVRSACIDAEGEPVKITEEQVVYVSMLARLKLEPHDLGSFRQELSTILEYMGMLEEVNTEGVEPTFHAHSLTNALRDDEVAPSQGRDDALFNAPKVIDGNIAVPKVIE